MKTPKRSKVIDMVREELKACADVRSKELEEIFSEFEVIWHPRGYTSEPPCLSPNEVKEKFKSAIEKWAKERYGNIK